MIGIPLNADPSAFPSAFVPRSVAFIAGDTASCSMPYSAKQPPTTVSRLEKIETWLPSAPVTVGIYGVPVTAPPATPEMGVVLNEYPPPPTPPAPVLNHVTPCGAE